MKMLDLNEYQAANLRWLIEACGYPCNHDGTASHVGPFCSTNTGDWLGEIYDRIPKTDHAPNKSRDDLEKDVESWLTTHTASLSPEIKRLTRDLASDRFTIIKIAKQRNDLITRLRHEVMYHVPDHDKFNDETDTCECESCTLLATLAKEVTP